eukprot:m.40805 g.40805  ORF g.40805 m.40805 type:complete len:154 (+) comp10467_c0_seq3:325-786(+)
MARKASSFVVGVDTSEASANALSYTEKVAAPGDTVHVAYCYVPLTEYVGPEFVHAPSEEQTEAWKNKEQRVFHDFINNHSISKSTTLNIERHMLPGDARQELPRLAQLTSATSIIIGSHGKGVLQRALLGSVSAYLSQHCTLPVTIVPLVKRG